LLGRGTIEGNNGYAEMALADFARAAKLEPDNTGLHVDRGQFFINQRRCAEAVADAEFQRYGTGADNTFLNLRCRVRAYGGIDLDKGGWPATKRCGCRRMRRRCSRRAASSPSSRNAMTRRWPISPISAPASRAPTAAGTARAWRRKRYALTPRARPTSSMPKVSTARSRRSMPATAWRRTERRGKKEKAGLHQPDLSSSQTKEG
jgi:hypothetical protein